jgi:hypothetical protein
MYITQEQLVQAELKVREMEEGWRKREAEARQREAQSHAMEEAGKKPGRET